MGSGQWWYALSPRVKTDRNVATMPWRETLLVVCATVLMTVLGDADAVDRWKSGTLPLAESPYRNLAAVCCIHRLP